MTLKSRCAYFAYVTHLWGRGVLSEHARSVSVLWLQAGRCSCSVSVSVLLAMAEGRKRASGRKKTLAELGVRRLPKARELWAKEFFAGVGARRRRVREKNSVQSCSDVAQMENTSERGAGDMAEQAEGDQEEESRGHSRAEVGHVGKTGSHERGGCRTGQCYSWRDMGRGTQHD